MALGPGNWILRITVEYCTFSYALSSSLQQCIFFGVKTKAGRQAKAPTFAPIAPWTCLLVSRFSAKKKKDSRLLEGPRWLELYHTSTFVAIFEIAWSAIVPGTNDTAFSNKDTPHPAFHAVTSLCSKGSQLHKILIPVWANTFLIAQIECLDCLM